VSSPAYCRFAEFYGAHFRALWGYLVRIGAERSVAEDLAQEAFVRWSESPAADWEDARARSYLFTIATRLLTDHWRRQRRLVAWEDADAAPQACEIAASPLFSGRAWAALTKRQQQLLWLAYVEEFTHDEIAAIAGLGSPSVRVLLSRAREALAARLNQGNDDAR
jgi:RNA polymerase sigma-70 factor (ECF subfamily)